MLLTKEHRFPGRWMVVASLTLAACGRLGFQLQPLASRADGTSSSPANEPGQQPEDVDPGSVGDGAGPDRENADGGTTGGGTTSGGTPAGDGSVPSTSLTCIPSMAVGQRDTDGDGALDVYDSDDDDDGLSDAQECGYSGFAGLVNGGFEMPVVDSLLGSDSVNQFAVPGWRTDLLVGQIDFWMTGHRGVPSQAGQQHVEVDGRIAGELHQDVATVPNARWSWAVWHRGEIGPDTIAVRAGDPNALATIAQLSTDSSGWVLYSGELRAGANSQLRLSFSSVQAVTLGGNLLDEVGLEPVCILDRDGDGCPDSVDRDADGDGVTDDKDPVP